MIPAALEPYALALVAAGGIAIGAVGMGWAQQARVAHRDNEIERMRLDAIAAGLDARRAADAASAQIAGLSTDLAQASRHQREIHVETIREVERTASPDRVCLGDRTRGLLQRAQGRAAEGPGAGEPAGPGPGPAPDPGRSASELAVAGWMTAALGQYAELRDRHRALAGAVRALPCVEVIGP